MPWQLFGNGRNNWSAKLIRGLSAEAAAASRDGGDRVNPPPSTLTMLLSRHTRRREFITVLAGAATWSLAANAQQVRRTGVLLGFAESDRDAQSGLKLFREELRKLGWTEGRNIEMQIHAAGGAVESIKRFAKELVALQPDLIVTSSTPATARCCSRRVPSR